MTSRHDGLDKILEYGIVGKNFVGFNEHGQEKFDKAKTQIQAYINREIVRELRYIKQARILTPLSKDGRDYVASIPIKFIEARIAELKGYDK